MNQPRPDRGTGAPAALSSNGFDPRECGAATGVYFATLLGAGALPSSCSHIRRPVGPVAGGDRELRI